MTTVLAIDTCFNACSAALWPGEGREPVFRFEPMERGHAERLVPMIGEVFEEAGLDMAGLSHIVVTQGPGSFTGARIGIAAARALALSTGAKVSPLSSLRLMAETARASHRELRGRPVAVAIDARRGEVYFEYFEAHSFASHGPQLLTPADAAVLLPPHTIVLGSGARAVVDAAAGDAGFEALLPDLAGNALYAGAPREAIEGPLLRPLYLRPPDAKPPTAGSLPRTAP